MNSILLTILAVLSGALPNRAALPTARLRFTINDGWRYYAGGISFAQNSQISDTNWERVTLPHTWNAHDPFDDDPGYRRDIGWYRRPLQLDAALRGKRVFLYFEGANQVAQVYVNGAFAGEHRGGYTAFAFDITRYARFGADSVNLISVKVDNSQDPHIPPLSVGYALYGGIYRDVWVVATDPVHLAVTDHAGPGVLITTPEVSAERARVESRAIVVNDGAGSAGTRVVTTVLDPSGVPVGRAEQAATVRSGALDTVITNVANIARPKLWTPDTPTLYTVRTEIYVGDRLADRVDQPLGFRWYRFSADSGFFLNGQRLQLRATNRHQDYEGLGSALSDAQHVRDLEIIKAMGANFLRLAHYPQDPAVLDAADRLGLLIWEEIPVVNYITTDSAFANTSRDMLRDLIRQHRNHPSVVLWGIMNEVFLWSHEGARIARQTDTTYMREVRDFAASLNALAHAEDPTRSTTMAIHGSADYDLSGVAAQVDVLGLNLYSGWYGGKFSDFGATLDRRHKSNPKQPIMISEYGAEYDVRVNSLEPERFDFSGQWQQMFHESHLRQLAERPFVAGAAIWNEFDFSQPLIGQTQPNMNLKGMVTFDRKPKDTYYLYQANWSRVPMVHIASHDWARRSGTGNPKGPITQPVTVYSNLARVELFLAGRPLGVKSMDDVHSATWQVPLMAGRNDLEARGASNEAPVADRVSIDLTIVPARLADAPFTDLAINVGSRAQLADHSGPVWVEDKPFSEGSYGFVGGTTGQVNREVAIFGTAFTPLFFTYRSGLTAYRAAVPDGDYDVELNTIEPSRTTRVGERVFSVVANGTTVIDRLDLAARYGAVRAATVRFSVQVTGGAGLTLQFPAIAGEAVLSGLRITKR